MAIGSDNNKSVSFIFYKTKTSKSFNFKPKMQDEFTNIFTLPKFWQMAITLKIVISNYDLPFLNIPPLKKPKNQNKGICMLNRLNKSHLK